MKKTTLFIFWMLLFSIFLFSPKIYFVQASDMQIFSNEVIDGQDITVSSNLDTAIKITGKVTLKNLNIICNAQVNTIIYVNAGSTLVLDNVNFVGENNTTNAIANYGKVEINNVQFPLLNCTYSIYNDSLDKNAILLHTVQSKQIQNIYLNSGAVYVGQDTHFDDDAIINIQISSEINDQKIGLAVVRSDKSFAGYYLDHFRLDGVISESDVKINDPDALNTFQNNYYLDYVGLVGDNFADYKTFNTYYYQGNDRIMINEVGSGDIIITKLNVWIQDQNSEYISDDNNSVFIASKFATSRIFLKYANNTQYFVFGYSVDDYFNILMDNCSVMSGFKGQNGMNTKTDSETSEIIMGDNSKSVKINVLNEDGDTLSAQSFKTSSPYTFGGELVHSRWIEFIQLGGKTLDDYDCPDGITCETLITTDEFALLLFDISETASPLSTFNFTLKETKPKTYDVIINKSQFTYARQNYLSDLVFSYIDESDKTVVLTKQDYQILDDDQAQVTSLVDAGKYTLNIISTNPKIVFTDNVKTIIINQKEIYAQYIYEYEYDGTQKSCQVTSIAGVIEGDQVNISFDKSATYPGNYPQIITLDNPNYKLDSRCDNVSLIVNKKIIDLKSVKFTSASFEYTPNVYRSLYITGMPEEYKDMVTVTYTGNNQTNVNLDSNNIVRPYVVTCQFGTIDDSLYTLTNAGTKSANLTITRVVIDINEYSFDNKTVVYDKNPHTIKVEGNIPSAIKEITYTTTKNGTKVENDVQTNSGTYKITATFILNDYKNYTFKNRLSSRSCELTIDKYTVTQEDIDEVIVFEDKTVPFDGNSHAPVCYSRDESLIKIALLSPAISSVGDFKFDARISLGDTANYQFADGVETNVSRMLIITKGDANFDDVYLPDFSHEYDGREYHLTIANAIDGSIISYKYFYQGQLVSTEKVTDAGVYNVECTVELFNHSCYKDIKKTYNATLTITPKTVDMTTTEAISSLVVYDGKPYNITIKNAPADITLEISDVDLVDCGEYNITITPKYNSRNYNVVGDRVLQAKLTIIKANYDISKLKFKDITKQYDRMPATAQVTGTLPDGLIIKSYSNNSHVHATNNALGYEIATVYFDTTNPNYNIPDPMTCKIKITPLKVTVKLVQTQFEYTGNQINVKAIIPSNDGQQILDGDSVNVTLTNNNNIDAGKYITYVTLDNSDYESKTSSLTYYINPIQVDMSDITFDNVVATYDGLEHKPIFKGNLPAGILPIMVAGTMKNVGVYTCYIEFKNSNANYITPNTLSCTVTITPKPILVEFSNYKYLVEDGTRKEIGVRFIGVLEENFDDYTIVYSDTPVKSGEYTITVTLNQNCNYTFANSNTFSLKFEILTVSKSYSDQEVEIKIKGEGFSSDANIQVDTLNETYVQDILDSIGVSGKDYDAFKLGVNGDSSKQEIDVSYKVNNRTLNSKYIRIFRTVGNNLEEINFETVNNTLKFSANVDDNIVIVYQKDNIESNILSIVIISSLTILSITGFMYLIVLFKKRKKSVTKFIDDK